MVACSLGAVLLGTAGCGVGQTPECQTYLDCQQHYDETFERSPANTNIFQPDGVCWESDDLAAECSRDCLERIENLRETLVVEEESLAECCNSDPDAPEIEACP